MITDYKAYHRDYSKKYYWDNREVIVAKKKEYALKVQFPRRKRRRKIDVRFSLNEKINNYVRRVLKGVGDSRKFKLYLGYDEVTLKNHLASLFDGKMSWENYGSYWHLDHIKPRFSFSYKSSEDIGFKECWALDNLRPLEKGANLKKSVQYKQ